MPGDVASRRVYGHPQWGRVRRAVLERDELICQIRGDGCTVLATEVDHVIPWRAGGAMYDQENLRAACKPCNSARVWQAQRRPSREW